MLLSILSPNIYSAILYTKKCSICHVAEQADLDNTSYQLDFLVYFGGILQSLQATIKNEITVVRNYGTRLVLWKSHAEADISIRV